MKDFYSIKEFCNLLGISRSTCNRWIKSGKLKVIQADKNQRVIIPRESLEAMMKTTAETTSEAEKGSETE